MAVRLKWAVRAFAVLCLCGVGVWQLAPIGTASAAKAQRLYVLVNAPSGEEVQVVDNGAVTMTVGMPASYSGTGEIAVNPTGTRVYVSVTSSDYSVEPYGQAVLGFDTSSGAEVADLHGGEGAIATSPDGSRLYAISAEGTGGFVAFDTTSNQQVGIVGAGDGVTALAVSPDSRRIYASAAQSDGSLGVSVYDASSGARIAGVDAPADCRGGSLLTLDGSGAYLDDEPGTCILNTRTLVFRESPANGVQSAFGAATGNFQVTVADGSAIADVDPVAGTESNVKGGSLLPYSRLITETSTEIYLANSGTSWNLVSILDPKTRTITSILPVAGQVVAMAAG